MSLHWKSELGAVLGRGRCEMAWSPGLASRALRRAGPHETLRSVGLGDAPAAVAGALAALRRTADGGVRRLPKRVRVTVPDECVYFAMLPATGRWSRRFEAAEQHFAQVFGRRDDERGGLEIRISLVDRGAAWLATAIDTADRAAWVQAFAEAGLGVQSIQPAFTRDLDRLARQTPPHGVLVLMRDEGVLLVRMQAGAVAEVVWERCVGAEFEQRVEVFTRPLVKAGERLPVVLFVDEHGGHEGASAVAAGHGWREVRAVAPLRQMRSEWPGLEAA